MPFSDRGRPGSLMNSFTPPQLPAGRIAVPSFLLCVVGLTQLRSHPEQGGHGLALWGLALSTLALIVSLAVIIWIAVPIIKSHQITVTEQTSNDSE